MSEGSYTGLLENTCKVDFAQYGTLNCEYLNTFFSVLFYLKLLRSVDSSVSPVSVSTGRIIYQHQPGKDTHVTQAKSAFT